jgi:hypothetical protein
VKKKRATKRVKSLPAKTLAAKAAKGVKGGAPGVKVADEGPKETITFVYGGLEVKYSK